VVTPRIWVSPRSKMAEPWTRGTTSTSAESGRMSRSPRPSIRTPSVRMRWRTNFLVTARKAAESSFSRPGNASARRAFMSALIWSIRPSRSCLSAIVSAWARCSATTLSTSSYASCW